MFGTLRVLQDIWTLRSKIKVLLCERGYAQFGSRIACSMNGIQLADVILILVYLLMWDIKICL